MNVLSVASKTERRGGWYSMIGLVATRWGLATIGMLLIICGLLYGFDSHTITYKVMGQGNIEHYISAPGSRAGYLQMTGSPTLYLTHENDFAPIIDGTSTLQDGAVISFVYQTDSTTPINETSDIGTHLEGDAYTVEQVTLFVTGSRPQVFTSSDYSAHPTGYKDNHWPIGLPLAGVGLLVVLAAIFGPIVAKTSLLRRSGGYARKEKT